MTETPTDVFSCRKLRRIFLPTLGFLIPVRKILEGKTVYHNYNQAWKEKGIYNNSIRLII